MTLRRGTETWMSLYLVTGVTNLVAALADLQLLFALTLLALMPLLSAYLVTARRLVDPQRQSRLLRLTLAALLCSWLGDAAGTHLPAKLLCFFAAQICYIVAFWPYRRHSVWRRPLLVVAYLIPVGLVLAAVALHAGPLAVPVVVYGAALAVMALLATGVDKVAGLGGALFVLSDSVLAMDSFVPWFSLPSAPFWFMLSYISAQALLVWGALRRTAAREG